MGSADSLQDLIVERAGELFREQGYAETSIKQIAKASGCTTAALYYYFEEGKQHILREVIHRSAREVESDRQFPEADTLEDFLIGLSAVLVERFPRVADRFNWIMLQFPTLPDEEKRILQDQLLGNQLALRERIGQYVADHATADRLAWMIYCSFFGYHQIFTKMEVGRRVDLEPVEYGRFLAQTVCGGAS
ncbi:MAG: TetR family transcriptional regulator [Anaerolineae bacterium]|nr:TetR family transcriptional regulator [Anaerolineae bacterium]